MTWHLGPLALFDLESTGVDPHRDRIVSAAVIKIDPDAWLRKERWLDDPTEPERDPWAHLPSLGPNAPDATA